MPQVWAMRLAHDMHTLSDSAADLADDLLHPFDWPRCDRREECQARATVFQLVGGHQHDSWHQLRLHCDAHAFADASGGHRGG